MRAVWGPASRPKLSSVQLPRQRANPACRGEAALNGFQTRAVTFNDAFSIFLAPFLAAATIVNLSWKEKQKKDWDTKLAEIDKEIELLRARELDTWNRVQLLSANRLATSLGRRSYSTAAVAPLPESTDLVTDHFSDSWVPRTEALPKAIEAASQKPASAVGFARRAGDGEGFVPEILMEMERLVATKLALRMLVQAHVDGGIRSAGFESTRTATTDGPSYHIANLLKQLRKVEELESAAKRKASHLKGFIPGSRSNEALMSDEKLQELGALYKDRSLTPIQLVEQISASIVNSPRPPSIVVYTQLVKFFHDQKFQSLVPLAISAIQASRLFMDEIALERIIEHVGHGRDARVFDYFLSEFTKVDSRILLSQQWEWHRVSGERIPIPSSANPRLVKTLATAALSLEQVPRAEAWISVLRPEDHQGREWANVIKAFLYHSSKHNDWARGRVWLFEAMSAKGLGIDGVESSRVFQTLIFRMLFFCVSCGRRSEYAQILKAAVEADIKPPELERRNDAQHVTKVQLALLSEWAWMLESQPKRRNITDELRIDIFQKILQSSEMFNEFRSVDNTLVQPKQSLLLGQQISLDTLTAQLSESKQKLEAQLKESLQLQASLREMLDEHIDKAEKEDSKANISHEMGADKRFKEQQSSLELLREELSRHRRILESELKNRDLRGQDAQAQQSQMEKLQQDTDSIKQRPGPSPFAGESDSPDQIEASVENEQVKILQAQVASLTTLVHKMLTNSGQPMTEESAEDSGYDSDSSCSRKIEDGPNPSFADELLMGYEEISEPAYESRSAAFLKRRASYDSTGSPYTQLEEGEWTIGVGDDHRADAGETTRFRRVRPRRYRPASRKSAIGQNFMRITLDTESQKSGTVTPTSSKTISERDLFTPNIDSETKELQIARKLPVRSWVLGRDADSEGIGGLDEEQRSDDAPGFRLRISRVRKVESRQFRKVEYGK